MTSSTPLARSVLVGIVALGVLTAASATAQEPGKPLQIGVLPNLSARVILQHYQPMRQYLERGLKRPVEILTAPDFKTFHERTLKGEYDMVATAAHFARLAQVDAGHVALVSYQPSIKGLLITLRDRPLKAVEELRGSKLAFANPQSLVALRGLA